MKIFFLLRHTGYLRNYEAVVRLLAERGHRVHLGFFKVSELYKIRQLEDLTGTSANLTFDIYPRKRWLWGPLAGSVRLLQTYLRFLEDRYQNAPKLRQRAASMLPEFIARLMRGLADGHASRIWSMIRGLRAIERAIPADRRISRIMRSLKPDMFLATPLIDLRASQLDWVKCAQKLNIKTGLAVASWDNLTNKSLIQTETDIILVWNQFQKAEAQALHRMTSSKIVVTGAQCYDRWFARRPSKSKEEFLHHVGLNPERPFILYLCSSRFIAPDETGFVMNWVTGLRTYRNPALNELGVLIRPHPQNALQWRKTDISNFDNVVIYPREGANPVEEKAVADFFDSMFHCEAAVGINTSPMIEAGILEKPVFTILSPEFAHTQEGTLHFHYLVEGGLLYISSSLGEHFDQISHALEDQKFHRKQIRTFIENFIRPRGLDRPATTIFVDALETFHQHHIAGAYRRSFWSYVLTALIAPLALMLYGIFRIAKIFKGKAIN